MWFFVVIIYNKGKGVIMENQKPKEPLIAVMLTFLLTGLGQIYAGQVKKGIAFLLINVVALVGMLKYLMDPTTKLYSYMLGIIPVAILFGLYVIIDAYRSAKQYNQANNLTRSISVGKKILLIIGILFFYLFNPQGILANYLRANVVQAFRLPSGTMEPTIKQGDRILVDKAAYKGSEPSRGDIIVFLYPEDTSRSFVKRLIASGGETVEIKDGDVYVNDELVQIPSIKNIYYYNRGENAQAGKKVTVPEGNFYVLGDNSASSHDSRYWGFVPRNNILGKVFKIYYPFDRSGTIK